MYRIYVPETFYWLPKGQGRFYGQVRGADETGCTVIYIASTTQDDCPEIVGTVDHEGEALSHRAMVHFTRNQAHLILKSIVDPNMIEDHWTAQIILYKKRVFANLLNSTNLSDLGDSNSEFINLALLHKPQAGSVNCYQRSTSRGRRILLSLFSFLSLALLPLYWVFKRTAVAQHIRDWRKIFNYRGGTKNLKRTMLPILLDVIIGLSIMTVITQRTNPGAYLLTVTHEIIVQLRKLLENLRGSPVGLKINVQLNDFLLSCFMYHINLWRAFLDIVSPAINYLFAVLSVFGLCGFSFQLAMLSDLLVLITIHAHCFYIYAAVLYRLEIIGLKALWRVVVGRRKNVLKNRVEAYDYKHSQLFLATLLFSSLLFLLPTVLVYYVVFSTVRLVMYCIIFTLLIVCRKLLQLPIYEALRYLFGIHHTPDNFIFELVFPSQTIIREDKTFLGESSRVTVVRIKSGRSPLPSNIPIEEFETNYPSVGEFLADVLRGDIKGFIRPNSDAAAVHNEV